MRYPAAGVLPQNFVAAMDPDVRQAAMSERSIQARISELAKRLPYTPIPREALRTIAMTEGDPMRRLRQDRHAGDPLGGLIILSRADGGNVILAALGLAKLRANENVTQCRHLEKVPLRVRRKLSPTARRRFDF